MSLPFPAYRHIRRGIELGFFDGQPIVYDGTEPVAIDAQAGKGKLTRFLGVNLVSPRTAHLTKIVTDPKDGELAWASWKTLEREGYRGLPDGETLKDIEHRSGKTSVMVRGFNVNQNQVNGSGDNLAEQARPLLQVEDIRAATGGEMGLLDARDLGFFTVAMPEFWERPEMSGLLRDVRTQPDKHAWAGNSNSSGSSSFFETCETVKAL